MRTRLIVFLLLAAAAASAAAPGAAPPSTLALVARDSLTGDLGAAVVSSIPGVGAFALAARAGAGAAASQGQLPDATAGGRALDLLTQGIDAQRAGEMLLRADSSAPRRQIMLIDARGMTFASTGRACAPFAGQLAGSGYCAAGDLLAGETVLTAVARTFELTQGDLADRLLAALAAGERLAGETAQAGRRSAAIIVVRAGGGFGGSGDRFVDFRVDDDSLPLASLGRIYDRWKETSLTPARMRSIDAFTAAGNFSAARSETERMVSGFNAELRLHPDDPDLLARIGRALASHDIDKVRALELAKRAATLAPGRGEILDALAECHFFLGHLDEAIAIQTTLVTKEPANDDYWRHLQRYKEAKGR